MYYLIKPAGQICIILISVGGGGVERGIELGCLFEFQLPAL